MQRKARVVAIVQARMGSTRLPGKVLLDIGGRTALARVVRRLHRTKTVNAVMVATSVLASDDRIVKECGCIGVPVFRGSELDVLDRYYWAAHQSGAEVVVRITSDCPVIDPGLLDEVVGRFEASHADYASNVIPRTYPRGLDVEVFHIDALDRAWRDARQKRQREHVTPYFYEHPASFSQASVSAAADHSSHRWTLDTAEDLQLIRTIYSRFDNRDDFNWLEVLDLVQREPQLSELNMHVVQKAVS